MEGNLRRLQLTQLEILRVIDGICRKHNIKYSLYGGTILGAVRHEGFIPWDDDIDICMERSEYNRFLSIWNEENHEGYLLQSKDNEPRYMQTFCKVRKDHTTFLQDEIEKNRYHTGIFVDIFPVDRISDNKIKQLLYKLNGVLYLLLTKEFVPPKENVVIKMISKMILSCTSSKKREAMRVKLLNKLTKYNDNKNNPVIGTDCMASLKIIFPSDMLDEYIEMKFDDGEFMCFSKWHEYLTCQYGDYMQLPPEGEREWKHHPIILDFEKNYEELEK